MTTTKDIKNTKNLIGLCEALNSYEDNFNDDKGKPSDYMDYSDLPTFGISPNDTQGVYSWDDKNVLIYDNSWRIVDRDE